MTKLEIKADEHIIKGKLKQKRAKRADDKIQFIRGKSEELLGHIQKETSKIRETIKKSANRPRE
jgi:uncharacterized protein YjbJ (UPF0337 family)